MQTFLPDPDFHRSAQCLDRARLGKQRIEALQLIRGLFEGGGWTSHPASKMWVGYEAALIEYGLAICTEWHTRGYQDRVYLDLLHYRIVHDLTEIIMPPWLGDERLHRSHRSNLLRKDEAYYRVFGWQEPTDLPYFWPSQHPDYAKRRSIVTPVSNIEIDESAPPVPLYP